MPTTTYQLTKDEQTELTRCETAIRRFVKSGIDACIALKTIKEKQLFVKTHDSFDEYCDDVWSIQRRTANRMIRGAEAYNVLVDANVKQLPTAESIVRPLVPLADDKKVAVWQQAIAKTKGDRITASVVEGIVNGTKTEKAPRTYTAKSIVSLISKAKLSKEDKQMIISVLN